MAGAPDLAAKVLAQTDRVRGRVGEKAYPDRHHHKLAFRFAQVNKTVRSAAEGRGPANNGLEQFGNIEPVQERKGRFVHDGHILVLLAESFHKLAVLRVIPDIEDKTVYGLVGQAVIQDDFHIGPGPGIILHPHFHHRHRPATAFNTVEGFPVSFQIIGMEIFAEGFSGDGFRVVAKQPLDSRTGVADNLVFI